MTALSDFSTSFTQLQQQLDLVATEDSANRAEIARLEVLAATLQTQLAAVTTNDALKAAEITRLTNLLTAANAEITRLQALVPPPATVSYLSDLTPASASNGWGPFERDRSNGEQGANDGGPIRLRGTTYAKGLGVHAPSVLVYPLGGFCSRFRAVIGIDDYVPAGNTAASVTFRVLADGAVIYTSPVLGRASAAVSVDLPVTGVQSLRLEVNPGASTANDHADWADARLSFATESMLAQFLSFQAARSVITPPAPPAEPPPPVSGTIPMSWDDPMFTGMTEQTTQYPSLPGAQVANRLSITIDPALGGVSVMLAYASPSLLIDTCRARGREGIRGISGDITVENTFLDITGQGDDHADCFQVYNPGGTGSMTIRNSHFRISGSAGTPNSCIFSSDGWVGSHVLENVLLSGGGFTFQVSGFNATTISMRDVYIEPTGTQYLGPLSIVGRAPGERPTILLWENVRFCTIVNGAIVPGALIPRPY